MTAPNPTPNPFPPPVLVGPHVHSKSFPAHSHVGPEPIGFFTDLRGVPGVVDDQIGLTFAHDPDANAAALAAAAAAVNVTASPLATQGASA